MEYVSGGTFLKSLALIASKSRILSILSKKELKRTDLAGSFVRGVPSLMRYNNDY